MKKKKRSFKIGVSPQSRPEEFYLWYREYGLGRKVH